MCGIAGLIHLTGSKRRSTPTAIARAMADCMPHRGPDDAGVWESADGSVALSHRRLSIVDLSPLAYTEPPRDEEAFTRAIAGLVGEISARKAAAHHVVG